MSFSIDMQEVVRDLLSKLGNACVLTRVYSGAYDANLGRASKIKENIGTFSTSMDNSSLVLSSSNAQNFNLSGFDEDKVMIPYIKGYEVDDSWLYNGDEIETIETIEAQNNIIAYILKVKG